MPDALRTVRSSALTSPWARRTTAPSQRARCMEIWGRGHAWEQTLAFSGVEAWLHLRSAEARGDGGDVVFVSNCGHDHIYRFALADVAGHGSAVAAFADDLRDLMHRHVEDADQTEFARHLNQDWLGADRAGHFATALFVTVLAAERALVVCNAGHPRPLWYQARYRRWRFLENGQAVDALDNLPIGIIEPTAYRQFAVSAGNGDLFVLYTDAYLETRRGGVPLGEHGLLSMLSGLPVDRPATCGRHLRDRLDAMADRIDDDRSLVVLRPTGP